MKGQDYAKMSNLRNKWEGRDSTSGRDPSARLGMLGSKPQVCSDSSKPEETLGSPLHSSLALLPENAHPPTHLKLGAF